mmetsp:Transcript_29593/g.78351  ORF Transcript_29593/g.78351 Transcript_29593/m.78351 type:complete len:222 (+) Transcript_29593:63-728(+)
MGGVCCANGEAAADPESGYQAPRSQDVLREEAIPVLAPRQAEALRSAPPAAAGGVTFDSLLEDLSGTEEMVFASAFTGFGGGGDGVALDSQPMREFLMTNSSLGPDDVDFELLKAGGDAMVLTSATFLGLLRDNAASEQAMLEHFLTLGDGEAVSSQECRSGLMLFKEANLGDMGKLDGSRTDKLLDAVMSDAGAQVNMEAFVEYCRKVARVARVAQLTKA